MPLFGEIVEPVSRALYTEGSSDEEETIDESKSKSFKIQWVDEAPSSFETFLLFHGQLAADFLLKILRGTSSKKQTHQMAARKAAQETIFMYKLSIGVYGCLCPSVDLENSNTILDMLLPTFKLCKQILVVATAPAPFYKGNDPTLDLPPAFMRVLFSGAYNSKDVIAPLLEPPNMVSGVPASVLSWCEIFKKPCCLYICYSDSHHLDSISAEPLVKIFSSVFEGLFENEVLSFQSVLHEPTSNLYM